MAEEERSCSVTMTVPFHDLDPLGVVWHGNYLKYFEIARDALFAKHDVDLYGYAKRTGFLFPVVRVSVKHTYPLRHGQVFTCFARLVESRIKLVVDYVIRLDEMQKVCARGRTEQVAVNGSDQKLELRIPEEICEAFGLLDRGERVGSSERVSE